MLYRLAAAFILLNSPFALGSCPGVPVGGGPGTISAAIKTKTSSCQVSPGMYVAAKTDMRLDSLATVEGYCELYALDCSGSSCMCKRIGTEERLIHHIAIRKTVQTYTSGDGNYAQGSIYGIDPVTHVTKFYHVLDSTQPNSTGPSSDSESTAGTYTFDFQALYSMANCSMPPDRSEIVSIPINVVACLPNFTTLSDGQLVRLPIGTTYIDLSQIPSGLADIFEDSVGKWNDAFRIRSIPVQLIPTREPCPACPVTVQVISVPACAQSEIIAVGSDGAIRQSTIRIGPEWSSAPLARVKRSVSHEIGHHLGIDDLYGCSSTDTVMQQGIPCNGTGSYATSPTASDQTEVQRTSYGGGSRDKCE